jgi:hypothetical protein
VAIQIFDGEGTVIRELSGPDRPGFNRIAWDLQMVEEEEEGDEEAQEEEERRERLVDVEPGAYTIRLTARGQAMTQTLTVVPDKRR